MHFKNAYSVHDPLPLSGGLSTLDTSVISVHPHPRHTDLTSLTIYASKV